jgi:hypothetical protein
MFVVQVSTASAEYGQWILVLRSFAVVTMVTAVSTFFRRLESMTTVGGARPATAASGKRPDGSSAAAAAGGGIGGAHSARPSTAGGPPRPGTAASSHTSNAAVDEAFLAVKVGHVDVVHYLLNSGAVPADAVDGLGRTLLYVVNTCCSLT